MIEGCRKQPCPEIHMNMSGKFNHVEKHLKSFSNLANRFNHYKYNRFIKKIVIWVIQQQRDPKKAVGREYFRNSTSATQAHICILILNSIIPLFEESSDLNSRGVLG